MQNLRNEDAGYVPYEVDGGYNELFSAIQKRYGLDQNARVGALQNQLARYIPVTVKGEITGLSKGDALALSYTIHAAKVLDRIFLEQVFLFVRGTFLLGSRIMITL
jgi:hypothetical protein